jgi:hypothetical protein
VDALVRGRLRHQRPSFDLRLQCGQRRAQLVRRIGDEALLGIAATPIASELSRARAQIETKLVSLPPMVKQLLVSLFDKQVMPLLIEAFRLRSAELARHVNHNTVTDTTLEQHLEQCAERLAADFAKHVMTLPAQYDKGRVQQARDAKGRAEAQLAKARSEVKSLHDDVKMRRAIDVADQEVLSLRKAIGVTRTAKLGVVAEYARNNPQHSRHFASLTVAEERLAALQNKVKNRPFFCALTEESLGEQLRHAEAEQDASQRIFDSVAADMMARERELDQVHTEAGELRSIEWRQVLQSWVDEVSAHVLPLAGPGALWGTMKTLLARNSPLKVRWRMDPAMWRWFWQFARKCNQRDMLSAGRAIQSLLVASRSMYDELVRTTLLDVEWESTGLLFVFRTAKEMDHYAETDRLLRREFGHKGLRIGGGPKAPRGSQLRAAAQTRSEAMGLGLRGCFKKLAIRGTRQFHPADRTAINAGGCDAGEKNTVPSGISFRHGLVAAD